MNKRFVSLGTVAGFAVLGSLVAPAAHAEERVCRGYIGKVTVDNLRVPDNATCTLYGTRVKGTIKVEYGSTLKARRIVVIGNVQAENSSLVQVLENSRVGGSVQLKQGGRASVNDSHVDGDIQFESNNGVLRALRNDVGGSVQIMQNVGGVEVRRNIIDGNLQCKANTPAPIGGGNVVGGNKEDQCRRL
jgi:hypothetical protein